MGWMPCECPEAQAANLGHLWVRCHAVPTRCPAVRRSSIGQRTRLVLPSWLGGQDLSAVSTRPISVLGTDSSRVPRSVLHTTT
jgi:hypothetical protein